MSELDQTLPRPGLTPFLISPFVFCHDFNASWVRNLTSFVFYFSEFLDIEEDIKALQLDSSAKPIHAVSEFVARLQILDTIDNAIFCAGYKAVLHIHAVVEECEIVELMLQIDPKTKKTMKKKPLFVKKGAVVVCRVQVNNLICVEKFSDFAQLGRFTLRTEGKTVAVGMVTDLPTASE
ncbi:UNVERIFIED_CONTAM: Eukaryotic peptide chain release factor GTP-binding subunit [Sesamum indicum]